MKSIQETAAMQAKNRYGRPFELLDARKQIQVLIDELGDAHLHWDKRVSFKTKKDRAAFCHEVLDRLRARGLNIRNLMRLRQRHIRAIARWMLEAGMSAGTMQSRFSILRWLANALGKRGMILAPADYGVAREQMARSSVASCDKSWSWQGIDVDAVVARALEIDRYAGTSVVLMKEFGLRLTESILLNPHVADRGDLLVVEKGAKGGRRRVIPIESESQRKALARAKELAAGNGGSLLPPGKSPAQERSRIYYVLGKLEAEFGHVRLNPHGLRHGFANDKYEQVAGVPPAVRGGPVVDRAVDKRAREAISTALGHRRSSTSVAYTGARSRSPRRSADADSANRGC